MFAAVRKGPPVNEERGSMSGFCHELFPFLLSSAMVSAGSHVDTAMADADCEGVVYIASCRQIKLGWQGSDLDPCYLEPKLEGVTDQI
jgi:hypothetical protein